MAFTIQLKDYLCREQIKQTQIMEELKLIEALCILHVGYSTETERLLYNQAEEIVTKLVEKKQLKLELEVLNNKLKDLNS